MPLKDNLLAAAKADAIPAGRRGLWTVVKFRIAADFVVPSPNSGRKVTLPVGTYTQLWRMTMAKAHYPYGDLVMVDNPPELSTHLDFMLRARGRVLITGLGLGCVARGCLANPAVESVTIVERDPAVLALVAPWMPTERCTIVQADALEWCRRNDAPFDCAWHDLWSDPDKEEPHLQLNHTQLLDHAFNQIHTTTYGKRPDDKIHAAELGPVLCQAAGGFVPDAQSFEDFRDAARTAAERDRAQDALRELIFRCEEYTKNRDYQNVEACRMDQDRLEKEMLSALATAKTILPR